MESALSSAVDTQPARGKLTHDGHVYVFGKLSKDRRTEFWRCRFKNNVKEKCLARLPKCVVTGEMTPIGIHSDVPDPSAVEVMEKKSLVETSQHDVSSCSSFVGEFQTFLSRDVSAKLFFPLPQRQMGPARPNECLLESFHR